MRLSKLFGKTLRDAPADAEMASHSLMLKSGMIFQVASGIYSYLPLAWRSLRKIEKIIREEMDAAGGQELHMPVLQPREIWQRSGRDEAYGPDMFRLEDRRERDLVLAPTHEELLTSLVKANVRSYRDLPQRLYQIQTKFRDEPRPRGGLIRVREFHMKDAYSFDADEVGLDTSYQAMVQAYKNIFARCGLDVVIIEADSGAIGGKDSQEFVLLADGGEDTILLCQTCHYAANAEKAVFKIPTPPSEDLLPYEEIHTPGVSTIEELTRYLDVPAARTLKAVFFIADGRMIFVVIRGDLDVNEVKLRNTLGATQLRTAHPAEVEADGIIAGSASPVGLEGVRVVADESVRIGVNFLAGANQQDYHLKNVNFPRDFDADIVTDIALAGPGHSCSNCDNDLIARRGIEVGHVFKLGTRYSDVQDADFTDSDGDHHPIIMGCYGIGVGRLLAAAIEQNHDERGIVFPTPISPYDVHLIALNPDNPDVKESAEHLYKELEAGGLSVLYDDRTESPGVKFNDADLLGLPVRVVVSVRNLRQDVVEVQRRNETDGTTIHQDQAVGLAKVLIEG